MIKTGSWAPHGHGLIEGERPLPPGLVALVGLGGSAGGGDAALGCCRKRRSRRSPVLEAAVAETGEAERVVEEVIVAKEEEEDGQDSGNGCGKACVDCGSTKTPLWRGGPAGPKTLCNACGIRNRKMRRKGHGQKEGSIASSSAGAGGSMGGERSAAALEEERLRQRQRRKQEGLWMLLQQSRKFRNMCGEEEAEAAVLLMALSTGLFRH